MQKSIISWTGYTWNPLHGCSVVSDGCRFCYAERISLQKGHTKKPWIGANAAENVMLKPHKLLEPYKLTEETRVFTNSMSDQFHPIVPDWFIAACFCVMLDCSSLVFQILTKRPERAIDWHERFITALQTDEFMALATQPAHFKKWGAKALRGEWTSPWGKNIWMGTSVEDARVLHRIDKLRQSKAQTKFLSCEPLIGSLGTNLDLTSIDWVIVGGESGSHLKDGMQQHPRWLKQEWAREIRDACIKQGVAYFYKQDSGLVTEQRPYLIHEDGAFYRWWQFPNELSAPVQVNAKGEPLPIQPIPVDKPYTAYNADLPDYDWPIPLYVAPAPLPTPPDFETGLRYDQPAPLTPRGFKVSVANFQDVKQHWNIQAQQWDDPKYVYVGRSNMAYNIPLSPFANTFRIEQDTPQARKAAIDQFRVWIGDQPALLDQLKALATGRSEIVLVCWCAPKACHAEILATLLRRMIGDEVQIAEPPKQLSLFDMPSVRRFD